MQAVEGTIAQHHENIPLTEPGFELLDDQVRRGFVKGGLAGMLQFGDETARVEALSGSKFGRTVYLADDHAVRGGKGLGKLLLKDGAARRVGAWLEERP